MSEPTPETAPEGISRRDVMQRGAFVVGAAALWSTPIVQTLGQRPAAAESPYLSDICPDAPDGGTIYTLDFQYTGRGCGHELLQGPEGAAEGCVGPDDSTADLPDEVYVVLTTGNCGGSQPPATPGGTELFAGNMTKDDTTATADYQGVSPMACSTMYVYEDDTKQNLLIRQRFHTSCSQQINDGDEYGPIRIEGGTGDWDEG